MLGIPGTGSTAGLLLALVAYPAALAYLQNGPAGFKAWLKAKFLNQTATDPGISEELFTVPSGAAASSGAATATAYDTAGYVTSGGGGLTIAKSKGKAKPIPAAAYTTAGASSAKGAGAAIAYARAQLGKPYKWGGVGPAAFDCSGLVMKAWAAAGVKIPRNTLAQLAALKSVPKFDLAPGDLIYPEPGHVQMFIGNGQIIEAPHTGENVRIMPLNLNQIMAVRRP